MPHFNNQTLEIIAYCAAALVLLFVGFRFGRWIGALASSKALALKEQDLFTAQKGFKALYEQELAALRAENEQLKTQAQTLDAKVEEYRKKAAGFGGLFSSGGKRADAMYALLLENEALEEALMSQNEKLKQERTDSLKEQMRSTGYRRVLMSQLLNDERIKSYVAEIIADDKRLPAPDENEGAVHEGSAS
jgi:cell division protein FtsB